MTAAFLVQLDWLDYLRIGKRWTHIFRYVVKYGSPPFAAKQQVNIAINHQLPILLKMGLMVGSGSEYEYNRFGYIPVTIEKSQLICAGYYRLKYLGLPILPP